MKNLFERICASIVDLVTSHIKQEIECSPQMARERFQYSLASLFPVDDIEPPSPPPKPYAHPKRVFGSNLNRADFPPEMIARYFYEVDGHVYHRIVPTFGRKSAVGTETGVLNTAKYRPPSYVIRFMGYRFPRSHIVFVLNHGRWPQHKIFHIDRDRADDRIENIQEATDSEISRSMCVNSRNHTGVKGVCADAHAKIPRYRSSIMRNGIVRKLGSYLNASEAHRAYVEAAKDVHGHFNPASGLYDESK
jgi:hypothetical protein